MLFLYLYLFFKLYKCFYVFNLFRTFIEMCDNLGDVFISDEEEPQPKTRKIKVQPKQPKPKIIRRSNFVQVRTKIYEKQYKSWINENFTKIYSFFQKVIF